jgi:ferritin-like metal-binding protein YciE
MKLTSLHALFLHELADLYDAEQQIARALPKMIAAATNIDLKRALAEHHVQTEAQITRLKQIAESLDVDLTGVSCKGMEGVIKEGEEIIKTDGDDHTKDAALIGAAQKVEHYEIAGYGTALAHAEEMEHDAEVELLQRTLEEEVDADELLTNIAESMINEAEQTGSTINAS